MANSASMLDALNLRAMLPASKERGTLAVDVTACLRNAIQSGLLPDGIELNQVALAEHLGVSRVPVREAMRSLQAEGWISARANYRAIVQAVSADRVKQILELRTVLEVHCLKRAARTMTSDRIRKLNAMCDEMDKLKDHDAWLAANRKFHRTLLESPGSDLAIEVVEQLSSQIERYLRLGGGGPMREKQAGAEHRAIVKALSRRDSRKAGDLIRKHIGNTTRVVLAVIEARQRSHLGKSATI